MPEILSVTELIGMRVKAQGHTITITEVMSAANYGKNGGRPWEELDDDWYIEFKDDASKVHYWKQSLDGGELLEPAVELTFPRNHHPECQCDQCFYGTDADKWLSNPSEY